MVSLQILFRRRGRRPVDATGRLQRMLRDLLSLPEAGALALATAETLAEWALRIQQMQ